MIDSAKAAKAKPGPTATEGGSSSSRGSGSAGNGKTAEPPELRVFGPPGLGELLRVSLALTGDQIGLRCRVLITELVVSPEDASDPVPLGTGLRPLGEAVLGRATAMAGQVCSVLNGHGDGRSAASQTRLVGFPAVMADSGAIWGAASMNVRPVTNERGSKRTFEEMRTMPMICRMASGSVLECPELKVMQW